MKITYLGHAGFRVTSSETSILIDPYLTENKHTDISLESVTDADGICVTHAAFDHIGDTSALAQDHGIPVFTEPATKYALEQDGVPPEMITKLLWGMEKELGDLSIRAIEAHHASTTRVDGSLVTGSPVGFLISDDTDNVYHLGDTSIFKDIKLFGELYQPDLSLVPIGRAEGALGELKPDEAARIAEWTRSPSVVPMHYQPNESSLEEFKKKLSQNIDIIDMEPNDKVTITEL